MITGLQLQNWKTHSSISLEFKPGVNVLLGAMGSGKSSILQAACFALFGTFAELKSHDVRLQDLITRGQGAKFAELSLSFNTKQGLLAASRKIDATKGSEATLRDSEGKLLAGTNSTAVNEYVCRILGTSEDIFLRNIYAMQNEIDLLLKMTPKERKRRVDELMGLDKFEIARGNSITLKNKLVSESAAVRRIWEGTDLQGLNEQVNKLAQECSLLKDKSEAKSVALKNISEDKIKAHGALAALREKSKEYYQFETRRDFLRKQLEQIDAKLSGKDLTLTKKEIEDKLLSIKQSIADHQKQKTDLSEDIDSNQKALRLLEREAGIFEEKSRSIQDKLGELIKIKEKLSEIDISELKPAERQIQEYNEKRQALIAEIKTLRKSLEELELAESTCPVCSNQLTAEKKVQLISLRKRSIAEKLLNQNEYTEQLNQLRIKFSELEKLANLQRLYSERVAEESKLLEERRVCSEKLNSSQRGKAEFELAISAKIVKLKEFERKIELFGKDYSELFENKNLYDLKEQREQYSVEVNKLTAIIESMALDPKALSVAELAFQELITQEQQVKSEIESSKELLAEKKIRLNDSKSKLNELKAMEHKMKLSEKNVEFLNKFAGALQATQVALRDELILAVNEVMNSLWLDLYPYDKWSGIRLSTGENDYTLQLKEADGEWISVVGFASGGERMLASLAVRIAFARILSPNFSLLILDEPTHNLDEKAIESLIEIIQTKLSDHIEQIIIVTHDEKLAEAGDNVIRLS